MVDTDNLRRTARNFLNSRCAVYGDTAVPTYKETYDLLIKGKHRAHTIIATDTFVKTGGEWKQVASHGSEVK